jgi:YgiT-type zinc finger domain-containing protein
MDCTCGGTLIDGKSCYRARGENYCFIIDNLPAFQCSRCGKIYMSEEASAKINILVGKIEKETDEIVTGRPSVHLYDYK